MPTSLLNLAYHDIKRNQCNIQYNKIYRNRLESSESVMYWHYCWNGCYYLRSWVVVWHAPHKTHTHIYVCINKKMYMSHYHPMNCDSRPHRGTKRHDVDVKPTVALSRILRKRRLGFQMHRRHHACILSVAGNWPLYHARIIWLHKASSQDLTCIPWGLSVVPNFAEIERNRRK